jgi:hypothetical protein
MTKKCFLGIPHPELSIYHDVVFEALRNRNKREERGKGKRGLIDYL